MTRVFSCQTICQKSALVAVRHPWVAIYCFLWHVKLSINDIIFGPELDGPDFTTEVVVVLVLFGLGVTSSSGKILFALI